MPAGPASKGRSLLISGGIGPSLSWTCPRMHFIELLAFFSFGVCRRNDYTFRELPEDISDSEHALMELTLRSSAYFDNRKVFN